MSPEEIADRLALRELVERYARLIDDRAYDDVPVVFTEDVLLRGPGFTMRGHEELREGLPGIERFDATLHCVHNQLLELGGDDASGETWCVASHLYEKDGVARKMDMGIRYQDVYRRESGAWRIARRQLDRIWQQDLPLEL